METPPQVDFQGMEPIPESQARVLERIAHIEERYGRITAFRVMVKAPGAHHRTSGHYEGCCHGNLALAERKSEGLGSSSGRRRCLPILQRFASEGAERVAGNKMALNVERSYGRRRERTGTVAPIRAI